MKLRRRTIPLQRYPGLGLFVFVLLAGTLAAKTPSMMWRVSKDGKTGYMLGSIHIADKSLYPLAPEIEQAFAASNHLLVELDIGKIDATSIAPLMLTQGMYPVGDDIWKHLTPETAGRLRKVLADRKLPVDIMGRLRPWVLAIQLSTESSMSTGAEVGLGLDKYFLDKARGSKTIEPLETVEDQLGIFVKQPEAVQVGLLESALSSLEKSSNEFNEIERLWLKGDAKGLDRFTRKDDPTPAALNRALREERNPHMADGLTACMASIDSCFMVVGAAHLVGKAGVADILKRRGYKVQQVKVSKTKKPS